MDRVLHLKNRIAKLSTNYEANKNIINKLNRRLRRMLDNA